MAKYVTHSYEEEYIDSLGNPAKRTGKKVIEIDTDKEPYYLTFLNCIGWMYNIRGGVVMNVMAKLMERAEFNTGIVNISTDTRRRIEDDLGISPPALCRALSTLEENGAITRTKYKERKTGNLVTSKCEYLINPEMFWKGDMRTRKSIMVSFRAVYDDEDSSCTQFHSTSTSTEVENFFDDPE